jgi:hypothetical protein
MAAPTKEVPSSAASGAKMMPNPAYESWCDLDQQILSGLLSTGVKLLSSWWVHMHPPKFKKSVIAIKISPYKHPPYIIYMHPQERCTSFIFALASQLALHGDRGDPL